MERQIVSFIALVLAVIACVVTHEVAHGYVALLNGDNTARVNKRLSLNPTRHFDLIGFAMLIFMRFGYARPVPVNPYYFKNRTLGIITVSIAGIVVNLLTAFFFVPIYFLVIKYGGALEANVMGRILYHFLSSFTNYVIVISVNLVLFNILPLYPLDGYNLLDGMLGTHNKFVNFLRDYSNYILLGLVLFGLIVDVVNLPEFFSPWYWYMGKVGGIIIDGFQKIWLPLFV